MTRRQYSYIYGGTVTIGDTVRDIDGTADCPARCDEARLRAVAARDVSRSEGVPLTQVEIAAFWFSEIVTETRGTGTAGADPFRPHGVPGDSVDPFAPGDI